MQPPEERVKIAVTESARLKDYLSTLAPGDWSEPTGCDRWEVRDVVAHLAWVAESYTDRVHQSLQENSGIPDGEPTPGPISAASFAEGNVQRAISRRESLGDQVFADFAQRNDELNQLMTTLGPGDWEKPHYYASLGTVPMRYRPDLWISELAMHGWDIRSRLEPETHLSDECLPVWMDVIPGQLTVFKFTPSWRLTHSIRYRWKLTGPGARNSDIVVEGDQASMESAGSAKADVTFRCDMETFLLVALGRLSMDVATATDRLTIEGNDLLAHEFLTWFPGA